MGFSSITQAIGVGYNYKASKGVRAALSTRLDHSSHHRDFTYFKKIEKPEDIVLDEGNLLLTKHPISGQEVKHLVEPEVAIVLGEHHEIEGYCLANDFTAYQIELQDLGGEYDPTYYGKCWKGSCSLGPEIVLAEHIKNDGDLRIQLRIQKRNGTDFDYYFNTNSRVRLFSELPKLIIEYYFELLQRYGIVENIPKSKKINVTRDGFLPEGTVVLTGAGIVKLKEQCEVQRGDLVTISSSILGELTNYICQE